MAKKMLVKLLLLLMVFEVLLVSVSEGKRWWRRRRRRSPSPTPPPPCDSSMPSGVAWANSWHNSINFNCPSTKSIKHWRSKHRNCKGDRIHHFYCGSSPASYTYGDCAWSGHHVNDYDALVSYKCPHNGFITGVSSEYSGYHRDRRFSFRCCHVSGLAAHSCQTTPYQNNWRQEVNYWVPYYYFLTGVISEHHNTFQDRRYKFEICKFDSVKKMKIISNQAQMQEGAF